MNYKVNDVIQGTITRILSYGAFMVFEDETQGLLHISEVADTYIRDLHRYLHVGMVYLVKVISIDETRNFLKVSLKQVSNEEREKEKYEDNIIIKKFFDGSALTSKINTWIDASLNININEEKGDKK